LGSGINNYRESKEKDMQTFDPIDVYAHCLFDASLTFPADVQQAVRQPFRGSMTMTKKTIEGMSRPAHEGLYSVDPESTDHYWYHDVSTRQNVGTLPQALVRIFKMLKAEHKPVRLAALAGHLAHLCIDAFIGPHLIDCTDGEIIRGRVAQDVKLHIGEMPFLHNAIVQGESFRLATPFSDVKATELYLGNEGWSQKNVELANCYLNGNGWPAASGLLKECYNKACNELCNAVEIARKR
jgi:hypothetical protein